MQLWSSTAVCLRLLGCAKFLIFPADKKECKVCERIKYPQGENRLIMESVCPDCRAKYVFIQVSGIDLGKAWRNFVDKKKGLDRNPKSETKDNNSKGRYRVVISDSLHYFFWYDEFSGRYYRAVFDGNGRLCDAYSRHEVINLLRACGPHQPFVEKRHELLKPYGKRKCYTN